MVTDTTTWLTAPGDAKRITARLGGTDHDIPILEVGPSNTISIIHSLSPDEQVEILSALRGQVDTLIELVQARQAVIRHRGDWGGDAA